MNTAITSVTFTFNEQRVTLRRIPEEATYLGTVTIFGTDHHFQAIEVRVTEDGYDGPVCDPHGRLEDIFLSLNENPQPTTIPGLPGQYVICIFPHSL